MNPDREEMLLDLLIKKAVHGLTEAEERQLSELEDGSARDESFELTASAVALVDIDVKEALPSQLRSRIAADADEFFAERSASDQATRNQRREEALKPATRGPVWNWLGWAVAGIACIALAANIWMTRFVPQQDLAGAPTPTPTIPATPDPAQKRQRLLETAGDVTRASWAAGTVKTVAPTGDVVWSDAKQEGYMRFTGLPVNDPGKETYQLWIFDETQDEKTPIDGGTFDVNADGEVIIPINAKLKAVNPKLFAVTVEKPGGVVVSKREKIVALAKAETQAS